MLVPEEILLADVAGTMIGVFTVFHYIPTVMQTQVLNGLPTEWGWMNHRSQYNKFLFIIVYIVNSLELY